jgi:5'(3')-deoxyribonucleotidase
MTQLFVDMDGVLADFDKHYRNLFSIKSDKSLDNVNWKLVHNTSKFYSSMPPMQDFEELWQYVKRFNPIVLTGVPKEVPAAASDKIEWGKKYLGKDVEVRCVLSKEKYLHANVGDILVDDWEKYKDLWTKQYGFWITHTSAKKTIETLKIFEGIEYFK